MSDAHVVNGTSRQMILVAKLLLEIDAVTSKQEQYWRYDPQKPDPSDHTVAVPMEDWGRIMDATRRVKSGAKEPGTDAIIRAVEAVNVGKQYDRSTVRVWLTLQQWVDLLAARDGAKGPEYVKAYASEYWNRHGKFPGG